MYSKALVENRYQGINGAMHQMMHGKRSRGLWERFVAWWKGEDSATEASIKEIR